MILTRLPAARTERANCDIFLVSALDVSAGFYGRRRRNELVNVAVFGCETLNVLRIESRYLRGWS